MSNKDLLVVIDSVARNFKENILEIKGWAFDLKTKKVPEMSVFSSLDIVEKKIKMEYRGDVNCVYNIPPEVECGFIIIAKIENIRKGKLVVKFEDSKIIKLDLNRKFCHPKEVGNPNQGIYIFFQKGYKYLKRNGVKNTLKKIKLHLQNNDQKYIEWIEKNEQMNPEIIKDEINEFSLRPCISIIMPTYNVDSRWLIKCIESLKAQYYPVWELCVADDASTNTDVKKVLESYKLQDQRIKVVYRSHNGHISEASNTALTLATGEFIGLLDNDDELSPNALYEIVKKINEFPEVDLIYSDEDKIDKKGKRKNPYFKSDWAPDSLMSANYICHFCVLRKTIVTEVGGFRKGYEGAQDYDLILRVTEKTNRIAHIPKVLYHWRMLESSTAAKANSKNYAFEAGKKALESALERRKISGIVENGTNPGLYDVKYDIAGEPLVSIIIPTRDGADDVRKCVSSIFEKTSYKNFEIILADNGSQKEETFELFTEFKEAYPFQFRVVRIDIPFNYAQINNMAVKEAKGKYLLFLNNDTEVITQEWMSRMLSFAQLDHVGAVGAKLYYPDDTIQHAGVVLGMGGAAGHIHYFFPKGDNGYFGKLVSTVNYLAVTGACLMLKRKDFEIVGGFDEKFTVAYNDVDLCIKLYDQLGRYNVWAYDAELYHFESKSRGYEDSPEKKKRFTEEINMLREKWLKYIQHDPFYNPNLTKQHADFSINLDK